MHLKAAFKREKRRPASVVNGLPATGERKPDSAMQSGVSFYVRIRGGLPTGNMAGGLR